MKTNPFCNCVIASTIFLSLIRVEAVAALEDKAPSRFSADFEMVRTLSVLKDKLESRGVLTVGGPGKLRWETQAPARSILVINGPRAWIRYPDLKITKSFELGADPAMKVLSEHLSVLTSGQLDKVQLYYDVKELKDGTKRLVPKEAAVKKIFSEIRVALDATGIASRVELVSVGGDVTAIHFSKIQMKADFPAGIFEQPAN